MSYCITVYSGRIVYLVNDLILDVVMLFISNSLHSNAAIDDFGILGFDTKTLCRFFTKPNSSIKFGPNLILDKFY